MRGADRGRRKAIGVVAGGKGPAVLGRVGVQSHGDVVRGQAQLVRHDLGQHRLVALALGRRIANDADRASGIHRNGRRSHRSVLGAGPPPFVAGFQRGDVAHVGLAGLDAGGVADAVQLAGRQRLLLALLEAGQVAGGQGLLDDPLVVARIKQGAGDGFVGKLVGPDQVPAQQLQRVHCQLRRNLLHHALHREVKLRAAEAAHGAGRALVGHHDMVGDLQIADVIAVGGDAVHPVEGRRHGCAQIGAVVVPVGEPQGGDLAGLGVGRLDLGDAVGRGAGGAQMLQSILNPLDRPLGPAGQNAKHNDVRKNGQLAAEAAAGVLGAAQAQGVGAQAQRPGHDGMQREGALEVGQHVEAAGFGHRFGNHRIGFHGGDGVARVANGQFGAVLGCGERLLRGAVQEVAGGNAIGVSLGMQQRRLRRHRLQRVKHCW